MNQPGERKKKFERKKSVVGLDKSGHRSWGHPIIFRVRFPGPYYSGLRDTNFGLGGCLINSILTEAIW